MRINESPHPTCHHPNYIPYNDHHTSTAPSANGKLVYTHRKIGPPPKPSFLDIRVMRKVKFRRTKPIGLVFIIVTSFVAILLHPWNWNLSDVPSMTSPFSPDFESNPNFLQILLASSIGLIIAAAVHYRHRKQRDKKIIPHLRSLDKGRGRIDEKIERFPHYVGKSFDLMSPF